MFDGKINKIKSLDEIRNIGDHFSCGLAICRINQKCGFEIYYLSTALAKIYETSIECLQHELTEDILFSVHAADRERVRRDIFRMMDRDEADQSVSYRIVTPSGRLKWLKVHVESAEQSDGDTLVYATYTDISDLKKVEHMVDVAFFNTGVSIWEYDFKRHCIIQYQNSTEMHGFEQIVSNVPESLVECGFVHLDSIPAFLAMYDKLFKGEPFAEGVFKVQTSDRTGYWYEHIRYTSEFDENGKPFMAVGMSTDETQRQLAIEKYERELEKGAFS